MRIVQLVMGRQISLAITLLGAVGCHPAAAPAPAPASPAVAPVVEREPPEPAPAAFFPEPPRQHSARPEIAGVPAGLVVGLAELHAAGLPDPRGCEYRRVTVDEKLAPSSASPTWNLEADVDGNAFFDAFVLPEAHEGRRFAIAWDGTMYPVRAVGDTVELPTWRVGGYVGKDALLELALLVRLGDEARATGILASLDRARGPQYLANGPTDPLDLLGDLPQVPAGLAEDPVAVAPRAVTSLWAHAQREYVLRAFEAHEDQLASAVTKQALEAQLRLEERLADPGLRVGWCEGRTPWCGWDDLARLDEELERRKEGDPSRALADRPVDELTVAELIELWEVDARASRAQLRSLSTEHLPQVLRILRHDRRVLRGADPTFVERSAFQLGTRILMLDDRAGRADPFDRDAAFAKLAIEWKEIEGLSPAARLLRRLDDDAGADRGWRMPVDAFLDLELTFDGADPEHAAVSRRLGARATELRNDGCDLLEALAQWDPVAARSHPAIRRGGLADVDTSMEGIWLAGCVTEVRAALGQENAASAYASYFRRIALPEGGTMVGERDTVTTHAWRALLAHDHQDVRSTIDWAFSDRSSPWLPLLQRSTGLGPLNGIVDTASSAARKEDGVDLFRAPAFRARVRKELGRCEALTDSARVDLGIRGRVYNADDYEQWVEQDEGGLLLAAEGLRHCDAVAYLWTESGYAFSPAWPRRCRDRAIASLRKSLRDPNADPPPPPECAAEH